ncbi:endonuclease/exonuclease/phosphatase family protein [Rhizobium halophytocola]|uniref:Endonuclease/exonuclease/phosphatase family metal-dependent hydrolase n=1 Tax=Rhizobium halophytocola TaxID=735519 RepID=A0ABS4DW23_9HYPH|nr:endonuclease/exonuclease/phosphatase family protein [Rhizobium halophytocola]MBP1849892.1 endonuclease/exonuclease/phosphatase family metal-dependent hydrolase [Rhizobium halophytocola]
MRILSLNVWGGMLHAPLLDYLRRVDADIYCLQEVAQAPAAETEWLTYRDGTVELQQRARLYDEIATVLPDHRGGFYPTARGELLDGDTPCPQFFGLATFVRDTIPVVGSVLDFIHGSYSADGFGDHPRSRNAHGLRIYAHETDVHVSVVHLHGLRDPQGKHDTPARQAQAIKLKALIEALCQDGDRLVVCGDFNLLPESDTFGVLASLGLRDLVTTGGFSGTRTGYYTKAGRFADYMLVNDAVDVQRFEVVATPEVSDHCALLLDLA